MKTVIIIEDGKRTSIRSLATQCIECDIRSQNLRANSDEVEFVYRQNQQRITAEFRDGALTVRKAKLSRREPLPNEHCDRLYSSWEDCSRSCSIGMSQSEHFFLEEMEDKYAGFSYRGLDEQCKAACSTGNAMDRAAFFKKVCRRSQQRSLN